MLGGVKLEFWLTGELGRAWVGACGVWVQGVGVMGGLCYTTWIGGEGREDW